MPHRVIPSSITTTIEFCASMARGSPSIGRQKLLMRRARHGYYYSFPPPGESQITRSHAAQI